MLIDDDEVERRLLNWARSRVGESIGPLGYGAPMNAVASSVSDPFRFKACSIPLWTTEARQTDEDINRLEVGRRLTVKEHYAGQGTLADKLARLGIKSATYYARLNRAREDLREVWQARDRKHEAERANVERILAQQRARFTE